MLSNSAPISIAPYLFDKPPYDPLKDFAHVAYIGSVANAFVVRPEVPAKTMAELVQWIKGQNKVVPFGSGGQGSIGHIIGEMFKAELGLKMEHNGYRGAAPMFQDMMAGQLDFAVVTLTEVLPLAKDGKLRMIALTSTQKTPSAPDVPLVTELGYPRLVAENFVGLSAPAGMPAAAQARLHKAVGEVLADPQVLARLGDLAFVTRPMTSEQFTKFVADQVQSFQAPVKASGAKL
jgi:tripartite-type tricarboxylate transporter receptor subunit TctC